MNMLETGLQWLSAKQKKHVSSKVLYCRDDKNEKYSVDAVLGRTKFEIVDENGFSISAHSIDFIIRADELPLEPENGDRILVGNIEHEVNDLGRGCWQWCDPHGIMRRIHTSIFKEH